MTLMAQKLLAIGHQCHLVVSTHKYLLTSNAVYNWRILIHHNKKCPIFAQ